jgi:hypothetical protein
MIPWRNLRDPRALGETPEGYLVALEIDEGVGWEPAIYCARPGGGGICDAVLAAIAAGDYAGQIEPWVPPAPTPILRDSLSAIEFWDRAETIGHTEATAEAAADAALAGAPPVITAEQHGRIVRRIRRATAYPRLDPDFNALLAFLGITEAQRDALYTD